MKKITGSVHLASTSVGLAKGVFSYLCEIIHSLSGGPYGIDLASTENRHLVLPPPSEGPLVQEKSQRCRSLPCILHAK